MLRAAPQESSVRNLIGWLIGFGASLLADQVFFLSLTYAALAVGSAEQVGLVLAAASIPRLAILLLAGGVADQKSPKRIIVATDTGRAVVMALAAMALMLGALTTWQLVGLALAIGALDGLFLPAVGALPARIAPTELMSRVAALRTVTQRVAMLAGGPLAGWLILLDGPKAAFAGSAVLFVVSVSALALVTVKLNHAPPQVRSAEEPGTPTNCALARSSRRAATGIVEGLRIARRDPVLPWLLILVAGMNFGFSGPFTVGLPLLAQAHSWGPQHAGLLLGGFGVGAVITGVTLVFVRWVPRAGMAAFGGVLTMSAALLAVASASTVVTALAATVVLGLASGVFGTVVHAITLTNTGQAELGRVMALLSLSVEGVVPVSFAATGLVAHLWGAAATFTLGGLVILVTTGVAFTRPQLRVFQLPRLRTAESVADPSPGAPVGPAPRDLPASG